MIRKRPKMFLDLIFPFLSTQKISAHNPQPYSNVKTIFMSLTFCNYLFKLNMKFPFSSRQNRKRIIYLIFERKSLLF